jgi:hypothetical protein
LDVDGVKSLGTAVLAADGSVIKVGNMRYTACDTASLAATEEQLNKSAYL